MATDYQLEDTVYLPFTTRAFATGIPTALAAGEVQIYEDASVTQITGAETLTVSLDSVAGFNMVAVAATAANGFETLKSYTAMLAAGTVGGTSVIGEVIGHFTLDVNANAVWDRVLSGATHNIATSAGRRLRNIQDFGIYDMASAWVDEVGGQSSGVVEGEDATVTNRADDFDNAQTIAASIDLDSIHIQNDNTITLTATLNGFNVWAGAPNHVGLWNLALGSQDIGMSTFSGASVSGIATGTTPVFRSCKIGAATLPPCDFYNSKLLSTLTLGSAGAYRLSDCESGVAGAGAPTIDMGAGIGATTLELRSWEGGITLNNLEAGDVVTLDGTFGTITLNGADATVEIRGTYKSLAGTYSGANVDGAILGGDIAAMPASVWDRVISKAAHNVSGSAGKILRQGGDLAQIDGAISDVSPTTTSFDTNLTQADNFFNDAVLIFSNGSANAGIGMAVSAYLNANGNMAFLAPDVWPVTPVNGDDFVIFATHVHPVAQITADIDANSTQLASLIALLDDARGEPGQGAPPVNPDAMTKIDYLYKAWRNKVEQTATEYKLYNDAGAVVDQKSTVSDDSTTATTGEVGSGA